MISIEDSQNLAVIAFWLRVIGLSVVAAALSIVAEKALAIWQLRRASVYAQAGSFIVAATMKAVKDIFGGKSAPVNTGPDGQRQVNPDAAAGQSDSAKRN